MVFPKIGSTFALRRLHYRGYDKQAAPILPYPPLCLRINSLDSSATTHGRLLSKQQSKARQQQRHRSFLYVAKSNNFRRTFGGIHQFYQAALLLFLSLLIIVVLWQIGRLGTM